MTSTLTAPATTTYDLYFVHEGDVAEFVKSYTNRDSATSRGRKAVRDLDAVAYRVDTVDSSNEAPEPVVADEPVEAEVLETEPTETATFVPEQLPDAGDSEMVGIADFDPPKTRRARRQHAHRVFLDPIEWFDHKGHQVRVVTAQRAEAAGKVSRTDTIKIFGHRAGLIDTVVAGDHVGLLAKVNMRLV